MSANERTALAGIRVAELGEGAGLAYAGKLFADLGAEVLKLEPPGGDPLRRLPPLVEVAPNTEGGGEHESGWFAWLNTHKRSLTATPERIAAILAASDVLLDGRPVAEQLDPTTGHAALRAAHPGLHIVSLSWFGLSGPYRDFAATDSVMRALSGLVKNTGPVDHPAMMPEYQGFAPQGLNAFIAACAALWSGEAGRMFEISAQDANTVISEYQAVISVGPGPVEMRRGINRWHPTFPMGCYECSDGWLGITILTPDQWRNWCALIDRADLAEEPRFATSPQRLEAADELEATYAPILRTRTAREWFEEGLRRRLPLVMVPTMADLLAEPVHQGRAAFATVRIGTAEFRAPRLPQHLNETPPATSGTAPRPGADDAMPLPEPRPRPAAATPSKLPLEGLRIVDMAMGWAGPLTTRQMADLGAEVIKIEGRAYPDWWRGHDYSDQAIRDNVHETRLNFNALNRNKTGITLDLTRPDGADLARRLVATADAVVENYSQGVLPKLGLDYPNLVKIKPDLVMVTMPAYAAGTAWSETRAYGSTLEQGSGLPSITGAEGWPPTMNHVAGGDPNGGFNAGAALIAALLHRKRTGRGQLIDLSQVECMFPLAASGLIHQSAFGTPPRRWGNRHPLFVPHGIFRCAGPDAWLVVAITSDLAFRRLCHVIARPDLGDDPTLATAEGRRVREDELEAAITTWTQTQPADDAMATLQSAGIAAGVARGFNELITAETHLLARGFWQSVDRPILGRHWQPTPAFRENARPYAIRTPAPTLGQSTREVLSRILALDNSELDRLEAARIIGEAPIPISERAPRSAAQLREAAKRKA
jgi:crotonobetainyl-CoA:carnitine CoA-transferase CaiB-like acyl-CoA transferase